MSDTNTENAFTGEIRIFPYPKYNPGSWVECCGQMLPTKQYYTLYSVIGNIYNTGNEPDGYFSLPDLRGRVAMGAGKGVGLEQRPLGRMDGINSVTLSIENTAAHTHNAAVAVQGNASWKVSPLPGDMVTPGGNILGVPGTADEDSIYSTDVDGSMAPANGQISGSVTVAPIADALPHDNTQPVLCMRYFICLDGEFPRFE